jgi:hypothetical protein
MNLLCDEPKLVAERFLGNAGGGAPASDAEAQSRVNRSDAAIISQQFGRHYESIARPPVRHDCSSSPLQPRAQYRGPTIASCQLDRALRAGFDSTIVRQLGGKHNAVGQEVLTYTVWHSAAGERFFVSVQLGDGNAEPRARIMSSPPAGGRY